MILLNISVNQVHLLWLLFRTFFHTSFAFCYILLFCFWHCVHLSEHDMIQVQIRLRCSTTTLISLYTTRMGTMQVSWRVSQEISKFSITSNFFFKHKLNKIPDNSTSLPSMQLNMSRKQHDHSKMWVSCNSIVSNSRTFLGGTRCLKEPSLSRKLRKIQVSPLCSSSENVLFSGMILSCIVVVLLCFVMEATKWSRTNSEESRKINRRSNSSRNQFVVFVSF